MPQRQRADDCLETRREETLKSLVSVFKINISELTERVKVIDKKSEDWQTVPLWVSFGLLGFKERKQAVLSVLMLVVCGAIFYLHSGWGEPNGLSAFTWLSLYMLATVWFAAAIHWVNIQRMW